MNRVRRWGVVALGVGVLVATPVVLRVLPAADSDVSASGLLEQVRASDGPDGSGWSGYVETEGTLQLPDADRFSDIGALFGESTRMRAWWRDEDHWRVDQLRIAGEVDLVHDTGQTTEFDYERLRATVSRDPDIRLPRSADLLPPDLAERLIRGASADDVSRIDPRRVAGISAAGLRVVPSSALSSVDHVDVWADPDSGVPLRVEVYAEPDGGPAFTTAFRDFSAERPAETEVDYLPTPGTELEYDDVLDIADAANQYAPVVPPAEVAGLRQTSTSDGAVGVYGRGLTQVIAIPLRDREADALRDQLAVTPGVEQSIDRTVVTVGPLGVILTGAPGDGGWLLAGTLNRDGLVEAADDVVAGFTFEDDR